MFFKNKKTKNIFFISDEALQKRLSKDAEFEQIDDPYKKLVKKTPVKTIKKEITHDND